MDKRTQTLLASGISAVVMTALCASGLLRSAELWFCDELFQTPETPPGDVVIIGITEEDFEALGPYNSWDRSVMASALEALASDPDSLPAVVAIDTLYAGTTDPSADQQLVDAAAKLGNVVVGTEATFGTERSFGATIVTDTY